jgi:hypothetical protein
MEDITVKKIARKIRNITQLSENVLHWYGYECLFDFLYIYLSVKYKSKCMIIFKNQLQFDFKNNEEQNQQYIDNYIVKYGNNMVNECISDTPQVYTFGLINTDHGQHQNLLIFRYISNENTIFVEHFEPHGSMYMLDFDNYNKIKSFLIFLLKKLQPLTDKQIQLITSDEVCPYEYGFQGLENLYHGDDPRAGSGFCALWVMFFMEMVLKFPDITSTQIVINILGPIQTELATEHGEKKVSDYLFDIITGYLQLASTKMEKYGKNTIAEIIKHIKNKNYDEIDLFDDTTREHMNYDGVSPPSSLSTITPSSPSPAIHVKRKRGSTPNPSIKKTKRSPIQPIQDIIQPYQTRSRTKQTPIKTRSPTPRKTRKTRKTRKR